MNYKQIMKIKWPNKTENWSYNIPEANEDRFYSCYKWGDWPKPEEYAKITLNGMILC